MIYFLILIAILLAILLIFMRAKNSPATTLRSPRALQRTNMELVGLNPFAETTLIDFTDFLQNAYDRECLEKFIRVKNADGFMCQDDVVEVSTIESDASNYARDLYATLMLNRDLGQETDLDLWDSLANKPSTLEMHLWNTIFALERGLPFDIASDTVVPGFLATPYYILKTNYPGYKLSTDLLPPGKKWFLPVKNICDVVALRALGYEFDSLVEDNYLRWYHLALTNLQMPTIRSSPFNATFASKQIPTFQQLRPGQFTIYDGAWFSFITGSRSTLNGDSNKLKLPEGGVVSAFGHSIVIDGQFSISLPVNFADSFVYYDGKTAFKTSLQKNQVVVVYIKLVLLRAYRRIQLKNLKGRVKLQIINSQLVISSDQKDSRVLLDSTIEDSIRNEIELKITDRRTIIDSPISDNDTRPINPQILQLECGDPDE